MSLRRFKTITLPLYAVCLILGIYMLVHSLTGSQLIGCGAGSGCDSVMGSLWAYIAGIIPVSAPAVVTYMILIICLLFLSDKQDKESRQLNGIIWTIMPILGGAIVGVALWFCYIQIAVLHQFCKYCTLTHFLGCVGAVLIFIQAEGKAMRKIVTMVIGFVLAATLAVVQVKTTPSIIYDNGTSSSDLPAFGDDELPVIGPKDAPHQISLIFDFQCIHCRRLHKMLPEVVEKTKGDLKIQLCPISLSSECNPYIPDGIDRFKGSCTMVRLALAVWFNYPGKYSEIEEWLLGSGDEKLIIEPEEAYDHVASIVGKELLDEALEDSRIQAYLNKVFELFGRTSTSEKSGIPRIIYGQNWLVPETDSADELISVIYSTLIQ